MAASRAAQNLRGRQAESDEIEVDVTGVDLEWRDVDFGKFFEHE